MGKVSLFGILSLFASMVLFAFELIGKLMGNNEWQNISIMSIMGEEKVAWISNIDFDLAQRFLNLMFKESLYLPLFIIAVILLIISGFAKK